MSLSGLDRLLEPWAGKPVPGVTIGIVRDGELTEHRSAGLASLELGVPIGPSTTFRIASVSKQFTTASVLLLVQDGKLKLADDCREYLPELPDLGSEITVAHLMHNTSGIRDMLELMRLGGVDLAYPIDKTDLLEAICRERALNFRPGTRYLYSNSNFFLLGLIVERLSGMSLPQFLRRRIFDPLGMTMTRMTESVLEPAPGLATGYFPDANEWGWRRAPHAFPLGGEGGLVSSLRDLSLWVRNYETHEVGGAGLAFELRRQTPFSNGEPNGYARGLQVHSYRGMEVAGHGGLWPGYKTQFLMVPDRRLAVIAISNNGASDPYHLALEALDLAVDGLPGVQPKLEKPTVVEAERYVGRWLDPESGYTADIEVNAAGDAIGRTWGTPFLLRKTEGGKLIASRSTRDFVAQLEPGGETMDVEADAGIHSTFHRVAEGVALPDDLPGSYVILESAVGWSISTDGEDMAVIASGPLVKAGRMRVTGVDGDFFRVFTPRALFEQWIDVRVERDGNSRITRLHANGGRARNLVFTRIS